MWIVLLCRRCGSSCGLGAAAVAAAQSLRKRRGHWALASCRRGGLPGRRAGAVVTWRARRRRPAPRGAAEVAEFIGAAAVWQLLRWCWQQHGVCVVVVCSRGVRMIVVRSRTSGAIHTPHTHTHTHTHNTHTHTAGRAGLERFGLVHEHKNIEQIYVSCRGQKLRKKAALRPWVVAPITMAATPAAFAGGGGRAAAASSTRTTTAEVSAGHRSPRSL